MVVVGAESVTVPVVGAVNAAVVLASAYEQQCRAWWPLWLLAQCPKCGCACAAASAMCVGADVFSLAKYRTPGRPQ